MSRMQEQRYELKYWVEESIARKIRPYVQQYLSIDEFGERQPDLSYPVHSLYLDSPALDTYWHTINGNKNRFKLRLRYYDDQPETPVFFEIKRRMNNVILKERGCVHKRWVPHLLSGQMVERHHLRSPRSDRDFFAVQHFQELMLKLNAHPAMHVGYLREAYEHEADNSVRVTMDRRILSAPNYEPTMRTTSPDPQDVFLRTVILELKFTNRFPGWFNDLVQTFDCVLTGAAKYAGGLEQRGEDWVKLPMPRWIRH